MRPDDLAKLAVVFGVTTDELLGMRPPTKRGAGAVEDMLVAHESRKAS